MKGIDVGRVGK